MSKRKVTFQDGDEEISLDDEVPTKKVMCECVCVCVTQKSILFSRLTEVHHANDNSNLQYVRVQV